jgi:hypothetical protein
VIGSILTELNERLIPAGWECERADIHYRFTAPDGVRVVELSMYPGQGGTVVDGSVGGELISMRFKAGHPLDLILDQLERWGALPQAVAR